jgi:hypothetical protein
VLKEIATANRRYAYRLLQCLTVARRPLRVKVRAEVLALDFDGAAKEGIPELKEDWRWKDQQEAVMSTCSSLITVVDDGRYYRVVQLSHFSVKEFLTSDRLATSSSSVSHFHIRPTPSLSRLAWESYSGRTTAWFIPKPKVALLLLWPIMPLSTGCQWAMPGSRRSRRHTYKLGCGVYLTQPNCISKRSSNCMTLTRVGMISRMIAWRIMDRVPYTILHCADSVTWQHILSYR